MYNLFLSLSLLFISLSVHSQDRGFKFIDGYCQKNTRAGYNPNYLGECGMFTGTYISHQKIHKTTMTGINLNGSSIYRSEFKNLNLNNSAFRRSQVVESKFNKVEAQTLDLRASFLKGNTWTDSNLQSWVATGARIEKNSFINCDLQFATFWGANLQESDFSGSDLRGANLDSTHTLFTKFKGSKFNSKTLLPFSQDEALKRGMIKVD